MMVFQIKEEHDGEGGCTHIQQVSRKEAGCYPQESGVPGRSSSIMSQVEGTSAVSELQDCGSARKRC